MTTDGVVALAGDSLPRLGHSAWQTTLVAGIGSALLGVLTLGWTGPSLLVAGALFGLYLLFSGTLQVLSALGTHCDTTLRILPVLSGVLSILLGLFCFRGELTSVVLLGVWIGVGWLVRGVSQVVIAVSDPTVPARGWQAFFGLTAVLAGIVLIDAPVDTVGVLTVLAGSWLLVIGLLEIIGATRIHTESTARATTR